MSRRRIRRVSFEIRDTWAHVYVFSQKTLHYL